MEAWSGFIGSLNTQSHNATDVEDIVEGKEKTEKCRRHTAVSKSKDASISEEKSIEASSTASGKFTHKTGSAITTVKRIQKPKVSLQAASVSFSSLKGKLRQQKEAAPVVDKAKKQKRLKRKVRNPCETISWVVSIAYMPLFV